MNIQDENYHICFNETAHTVEFHGTLRLNGMAEYSPILDLLNHASANPARPLVLDLRDLEFLNSSGIAMLSKFVIGVRNGELKLTVLGSTAIPWQGKSLTNLKRLMPGLALEII